MAQEDPKLDDDIFEGFVAHPEPGEDGWYFCFVRGDDLGKVAEKIQWLLEHSYVLHGSPFVFEGKVHQAMFLPMAVNFAKQKMQSQKHIPAEVIDETEPVVIRLAKWLLNRQRE